MFLSIGIRACSSAWIEQVASNHKVGGSNPSRPNRNEVLVLFRKFLKESETFVEKKSNR